MCLQLRSKTDLSNGDSYQFWLSGVVRSLWMTRQETDDVGSGDLNVLGYFGCLLRLVPFNDITDGVYAGMVKKFECWLYFDGPGFGEDTRT